MLSALRRTPGVVKAQADPPWLEAMVEFDGAQVCADELVDAIVRRGYPASVVREETAE